MSPWPTGFAAFSMAVVSAMLTIGKLGTSRGRLEYYDAQVAAGVEDYYAGRGESPGQWRGTGALAMGLTPGAEMGSGARSVLDAPWSRRSRSGARRGVHRVLRG
jgi:TrwC relaxase